MTSLPGLRILHITEAPAGGVGKHIVDLTSGLLARGHDAAVIYSPKRIDEGFLRSVAEMDQLKTHVVNMRRAPHFTDATAYLRIRRYIRSHGPFDVIHGHSSKGGALARLVGRSGGARIVYTPHCIYTMNQGASRAALQAARAVEKGLCRWTDAIVAVSPDEHDHLLELGLPAEKLRCIVNGIHAPSRVDRRASRRKLGLPDDAVVVGFIGRLAPQKDPILLIRAFAALQPAQHVRLAIAGTGELQADAARIAADLGVADRIHWLGYRSAEEFMPALDVYVLPSKYEGMPYVLLEALSIGLPIVTTDVAGARLAVDDGRNGYIIPPSSCAAMAEAVGKLIEDPQRRRQFGWISRERVERFPVDQMVEETISAYEHVLMRRFQRSPGQRPLPASHAARFQEPAAHTH